MSAVTLYRHAHGHAQVQYMHSYLMEIYPKYYKLIVENCSEHKAAFLLKSSFKKFFHLSFALLYFRTIYFSITCFNTFLSHHYTISHR